MSKPPATQTGATAKRPNDAQDSVGGADVTQDAFLGGRVVAWQPKSGFRAGLDSVLLAAAVPASPGATVFDLGMGAGVASLCLAARVKGVAIEGLEIARDLCALARRNAQGLGPGNALTVHMGDAMRPPSAIPRQTFDHVMTNPPFLDANLGSASPNQAKARATALDLQDEALWFKSALALLRPKGWLTVVHRADALLRIVGHLGAGAGDVTVIPLFPAQGKPATRIVLRARKGGRGPLTLCPGLVLHASDGSFTPEIQAILRDAQPLVP